MNFQENPYKYIMRSDIFILSSIYEGLPNVLLEAMTLKKLLYPQIAKLVQEKFLIMENME